MLTITRNLPLVSFAGNPMKVTVQSNNTLDSGYAPRPFYTVFCKVTIEIDQETGGGLGYEIIESAEPDASGNVTFDISKIIKDKISPTFQYPQSSSTIAMRDYVVARFYLAFADGYGIPFVEQAYQADEGPYYAIPGGLSDWLLDELEADGDTCYDFLLANKPFLTSQPESKRVRTGQPEYLRFLYIGFGIAEPDSLMLKEYALDGGETTTVITTINLANRVLYSFDVTPGIAFTLQSDTDSWEIWLDRTGTAISEVMSYRLDEQLEPRSKFFIFQNSMGGFDSVAATGKRMQSIEGETGVNMIPLSTNMRSTYSLNQDRPLCKELWKGFIGLFTETETEWLQEFFRSEKRYFIGPKRLENVGLKSSGFQLSKDDPVPTEVEIDAYIGVPDFFFSRLRAKRVQSTITHITASASELTDPSGSSTITLSKTIPDLTGDNVTVKIDGSALILNQDYTISGLDSTSIVITFTEAYSIIDYTSVITVEITKTLYEVNSGVPISIPNGIPEPVSEIKYGRLYNWYALNNANFAPVNWKVPEKTDLDTLVAELGGNTVAGGHLKETGTIYWGTPNSADNSSNFSTRGSGHRYHDGVFYENYYRGYIASKTIYTTDGLNNKYVVKRLSYNATTANESIPYFADGMPTRLLYTGVGTPPSQITDYDGNIYDVIQIGTQYWLKQNWACTKLNDGTPIPEETGNSAWAALTTGAWCAYNNDYNNI